MQGQAIDIACTAVGELLKAELLGSPQQTDVRKHTKASRGIFGDRMLVRESVPWIPTRAA
jgi:hypothetical protein